MLTNKKMCDMINSRIISKFCAFLSGFKNLFSIFFARFQAELYLFSNFIFCGGLLWHFVKLAVHRFLTE